jgi:hypothetical protein
MPKPRPNPISLADAQRAARKALRQIIARDRKMTTFPAEFLNVDLDIKSKVGLGMLVEAWDSQALLRLDKMGRRHWLRMMLSRGPESPTEAIRRFAKLVRELPTRARAVWTQATTEFDIGIQAGFDHHSGEWVLEPEVLQTAADLGARLRFTVYSPLILLHANTQRPTPR